MAAEPVPFQYVIVRVVPRVERGEQLQRRRRPVLPQGSTSSRPASSSISVRLAALAPGTRLRTCGGTWRPWRPLPRGTAVLAPVARLDRSARFHWLASPSSTILQPSPIHTGLCGDPPAALDRLFAELVAPVRG